MRNRRSRRIGPRRIAGTGSVGTLASVAELLSLVLPDSTVERTLPVDALSALAIRHGVVGELVRYARHVGDEELLQALGPEDGGRRMRLMRNALTVDAVHQLLVDVGVRHVFLKGLGLAALTRPEPEDRTTNDIDVLVGPGDLLRVIDALIDRGATFPQGRMPIDDTLTSRAYVALRAETLLVFALGPVDLHWRSGPDRFVYPGTDLCVANAQDVAAFGVRFPTLSPSIALWHASLHLRGTGYRRLRHILDVAELDAHVTVPAEAPRVARTPIVAVRALAGDPHLLLTSSAPSRVSARHWTALRAGLADEMRPYGLASRARAGSEILVRPTSLRMAAMNPAWIAVGPIAKALRSTERSIKG